MLYHESQRLGRATTVGFLALTLIILFQLGFSGWTLHRMHSEMSVTLVNLSDIQIESLELKSTVGELRRFEKDILLAGREDAQGMATAEKRWADSLERALALVEKIRLESKAHGDSVAIDAAALERALTAYGQGVQALVPELKANGDLTAQQANARLLPAKQSAYALSEELDRIVEKAEEQEQEAIARLVHQRRWLMGALGAIGVVSLLISLALGLSVTRSSLRISRSLEHQSLHDTLTGLLNRRGLTASMNAYLALGGALAYVDLDRFKLVNDLCGHTAGDDLLVELTQKISTACQQRNAQVARLGGDEFAIWMGGETTLETIRPLAQEIVQLIEAHHFVWLGQPMLLGASIGLAMAQPGDLHREAIARADAACRLAKQPGGAKVLVYEEADPFLVKARQEEQWAVRLPQFIRDNRFLLYGQCVFSLQPHRPAQRGHVEVLLRGLDDQGHIVSPMTFITAAERFNLMPKIDRWVIETLLASPMHPDCDYAVNLSGQTLMDKDYLPHLEALLRASGRARQISFEITESAAMSSIETAREYIRRLKVLGCRFALDDFGSGFSSFAYLRDLQVDYLKIDGSLIRILGRDASDAALVEAIVRMSQALGLQTIAEFVETDAIAAQLTKMGVDYGQGYGLHLPEPLAGIGPGTPLAGRA